MTTFRSIVPAALVACVASPALAGVIVFDDRAAFGAFGLAQPGTALATESFDTASGFAAGGFTGNPGAASEWFANAQDGMIAQNGALRAASANSTVTFSFRSGQVYGIGGDFFYSSSNSTVTFSFRSGQVYGIGGDFFYSSSNGSFGPGLMVLNLSDGTSYVRNVSSPTTFAGFWSLGSTISSLSITPFGSAGASNFVATDNMAIGFVPSPGAIALLGLAGMASRRRRA